MASVTDNRPPESALLEPARSEERYVDEQIRRTRRALKMVDLSAGMITLVVGVLSYLLVAAMLEHWVVPGGWSPTARAMLLIVLVGGAGWFSWRSFWPLVSKPINPAFAAQAIERSSPSLKNSLLNLLLLRDRRRQISRQVYQAIERQAAQRLAEVPVDSVIDRGAIIRLGRILAAVVALFALYLWLSPKNPIDSAGRLLMPWSDITVPSRVRILEVQPGNTSAARGEQLSVSAEITGMNEDEPVRLRYSTADGQIIEQEIPMSNHEGGPRFECRVPGRIAPGGSGGIQNDLTYWIEAGDARSPRYEVAVFSQPTLVVDRIRYEYPSYTGYATREVENTGDISAVEGTIVTIWAVSNQPIDTAHVDFEADGRHDLLMNSEDSRATTSFPLELRDDRLTPRYQSYVLRYSTVEGRKNPSPPKYHIDVERDYAPEIELLAPTEKVLDVGLHDQVVIEVEARDPDYAVRNVAILGEVAGSRVLKESLLGKDHTGRFVGQLRLVPAELDLKVGDVLEYWAAAADNRLPEPNLAFTEHQKIRVVGPGEGGGEKDGSQDGQQDQEQGEGEDGEQGEEGQQGQDGQAGGAGEENQQANPDEQSGEGGIGQQGGNPGENSDQQQGIDGETSEGDDQSDAESEGSAGGNSPSDSGENSPPQENSDPTDSQSGDDPTDGEPSGGEGKVSPEGDDDGTAFERIAEHLKEQEGESEGAEGEAGDGQKPTGDREGADGAPSETDDMHQGETDDAAGAESERTSEGEGAEGEDSQQQEPGDREAGQPEDDSSAPGGEMQENQGPAGAGENPGEDQGAPDPGREKKPNDKPPDDATGDAQNDQEAPAQGEGDHESDSKGGQGGDRTGGGQEGAGQKSDTDGTGSAGENQAADDGSGQAGEQGEGEAGAKPGGDEQAAGETGESSGDQPGQGSEQSGESGSQAGGEQDSSPDQQAGDSQSPADSSAGGQPQAGGSGGSSDTPPPTGDTEPGDDANLDYARRQTNLVIDKLDDQLRKQEVDEELLDKLGWTADELLRFVDRWKNLKSQADGAGAQAEEARQELDEALRSLGLGRKRRPGFQAQTVKDKLRDLQEAYRGRTPLEYQELMRKYVKGTASGSGKDE